MLGDAGDPGSLAARQLEFWRGELAGLPEEVSLPVDRPRRVGAGRTGEYLPFEVGPEVVAGLRRVGQRCEATLFMVLQAGLAGLLTRLGAGTDVPLGTAVAGRSEAALDDLVGFFVNTLVLRTDTAGDPSFAELVRRVRDRDLAAFAHQDVPFERVVEAVNPVRSADRHPLFQTMLVLQNNLAATFEFRGLNVRQEYGFQGFLGAKFDLTFTLDESGQGLRGAVEFCRELFDRESVERLVACWTWLLAKAGQAPELRLSGIDILGPQERARLLEEGTGLRVGRTEAGIVEAFQRQVAAAPDAVAVSGDKDLTYAELDAWAGRLAARLAEAGVGQETPVALMMPRSVRVVVAVLAVLKAGGYYVPLPDAFPGALKRWALEQTGARVLLAEGEMPPGLGEGLTVLSADDLSARPLSGAARTAREQLAYVMFTSGSTGQPKGVAVDQGSVVAFAADRCWRDGDRERVLFHSPHSFDPSVYELFVPLLSGGTVVVAPPDPVDVAELTRVIRDGQVTSAVFTAALFNLLAEEAPGELSRMGLAWSGGDIISESGIGKVLAANPEMAVANAYGATETTVISTWHPVHAVGSGGVPVGRPMDGVRVYVLDERLQLAPSGVPGEIYVGGAGLARGYWGRPDLTAERFVADPFVTGQRMYRTGDLGRWNRQGRLEFIGRTDEQVKIRGFRVEPGQIEAALRRVPEVSHAAVIVREDRPGDRRLVAYVVRASRDTDLREHLRDYLPDHMVPTAVLDLDALPLTANGKLDRRALPAPGHALRAGRAARDPAEQRLCELFADVLAVDLVGIDDNFFDLGGQSLLATRLVARIRAELGLELNLRTLFTHPTIAGLVGRLAESGDPRPLLRPVPRGVDQPLSAGQHRILFMERSQTAPIFNVPLAYRLSGRVDRAALQAALNDVAARHEPLRTIFPGDGARLLPTPAIKLIESGTIDEAAASPFNITAEPPFRAHLVDDVLVLVLHHIACDGWSLEPLTRDLAVAYASRVAGRMPVCVPLAIQYGDYAVWQSELLGDVGDPSSLAARQSDYWQNQLAGLPEELGLATDRLRPENATYRGDAAGFELDPGLHRRLTLLGRQHRASLFMVVQAGLAALLGRLTGSEDVPIGTGIAGRTDEALTDLVGFFVNTLVMRADLSGRPSFPELIERVRDTALEAYANQDLPFDRVVEIINPRRGAARHPLFQVMLGFQNMVAAEFGLVDLEVEELPGISGTVYAKYDLEFILRERPDGGAAGLLIYSTDLFDRSTVQTLLDRLIRLLEAAVSDPRRPVADFDILSEEERRLIFHAPTRAGSGRTVPELVERQAAATPERTALICDGEYVNYRELNARANRLAHHLMGKGIGPEDLVAVNLPRSPELIVALLGVLKAGAAYLPIASDCPAERVALMIQDAKPCHVIDNLEAVNDVPGPANDPGVRPDLGSTAYVIYTSGSTGRPKGVVVEHRSLAGYLSWTTSEYPSAGGTTLVHSSISFDLTATALYTPLAMGGCVVLAPLEESAADPVQWPCTFLKATPSHLPILNSLPPGFSPTTELLLGGEALTGTALTAWRQNHPNVTVRNVYGPTEATVNCAEFRIPPGLPVPPGAVPIGRPQANARLYVLDRNLRPVPPGVTGDLYLAGERLARGYLNRSVTTAERFVADPFGPPGARMYRSGDLARWRRDGQLEFAGRADRQLKVRGFRIEPGEVEAVLCGLPGVEQATVMSDEQQRLVAYVSPADVDCAALRDHATRFLPGYMVPTVVVPLDRLPLTPHGKLDVAALPTPSHAVSVELAELRDPTERALADIWKGLLGVGQVGGTESFFDVGGHSLLAARLLVRIREELGITIPLQAVFATPTIEALARYINGRHGPEYAASFDPQVAIAELLPAQLPPFAAESPRHLLLTGATGFVGGHLLIRLLEAEAVTVHCLVRASDSAVALRRLRASLEARGLWSDAMADRIRIIAGDLAAPLLGLPPHTFDRLAGELDAVLHNGAQVDAVQPYTRLAAANVGGTAALLRLAAATRHKAFHHVSTVSADAAAQGLPSSGYAQTKLDAERLVNAAAERGLETAIYRLPRVIGETGRREQNERDIVFRLLRIAIELGVAPDLGLAESWIPADQVAGKLAALALEPPGGQRIVLSAAEPVRIHDVLQRIRRRGHPLRVLPTAQWLHELADKKPEEHTLLGPIIQPDSNPMPPPARHQGFVPVVAGAVSDITLERYLDHLIV